MDDQDKPILAIQDVQFRDHRDPPQPEAEAGVHVVRVHDAGVQIADALPPPRPLAAVADHEPVRTRTVGVQVNLHVDNVWTQQMCYVIEGESAAGHPEPL